MSIHAPTIQHRPVPAVPNLVPAVLTVIGLAVLATVILLTGPLATPQTPTSQWDLWMTRDRHEEIDPSHSGPNADVWVFRQGEIKAALE
jgi:hypothetical protein